MAEKTFHSLTLPGQDTARVPLTAAEFSTSVAYKVKDYCTYQGKLYRCTVAHAAGAWNVSHFVETDMDTELDRKLDIPPSQAGAPANPRVGDLWIDNDENSPIYNVDVSPTLGSTNAVQSGGTKVALNSLDSRKMEHGVITGDFSASVDYRVGDLVFYATTANGITTRILYRCTIDHNAAAWNAAHFTATTLEVELQKIRESEADTDMIGDLFGTKSTYAIGDYCVYNDNLYRCIRAVDNSSTSTPAFDPDDWIQVKLANDVSDLNSALNNESFIQSKWIFDIYNSSTGNILDNKSYIDNYIINSTPPYIQKINGRRISRFIPVEGLTQITVSYECEYGALLFLSDAKLDNTANINEYNLTGTHRTLTVPTNAKYALVSARFISDSGRVYNFLDGMKISRTNEITTDEFSPVYSGNPYIEKIVEESTTGVIEEVEAQVVQNTSDIDILKIAVEQSSTDIDILNNTVISNVQIDSPWIYDIYGSSSDNILDSEHYVSGYKISAIPPYIVKEDGSAMSRFIYVEDLQGQQITATYVNSGAAFLFLSDAKLDNTANISEFNLTNSSRTLTVPANAKYALVCAREKTSTRTWDYLTGMKISRTASATTDEFSPVYIGNKYVPNLSKTIQEQNIIVGSSTKNILDTSKYVVGYRGTDVSPYFMTDISDGVMSHPIFVQGYSFVTVRSSNIGTYNKYAVFTSQPEMNAAYVVGTGIVPGNVTGEPVDTVLSVPSNAVWMYCTLKARSTGDDWIYDTVAYGTKGTSDAYNDRGFRGVMMPSTGKILMVNADSTDSIKEFEKVDTLKKFVPITVGGSNSQIIGSKYSRANFLFFSDSHVDLPRDAYNYSIENVQDTIEFANSAPFDLDAVIHAGDVVTGSGVTTQANWINSMKPFFDNLKKSEKPAIFAIGNHDTNDWGNTPANAMDDTAWGTAWLDYAEETYGIVRQTKQNGHKSTWHYIDFPEKKIRVISVDVQDTDKSVTDANGKVLYSGQKAWYVSNEQMNWIAGTALNFDSKDEKDWGVIMVMHQSMSYLNTWHSTSAVSPAYESAIQKLLMLCKAFNTQGTYTENYTFAADSFYNLSINADFTRYASEINKPYMICWLCGHEHVDKEATVEGINIIWTLNGSATSDSGDARVARILKTSTQNAFNLISVDTKERKLRIVRYGAGKNCFGVEPYTFMETGLSF